MTVEAIADLIGDTVEQVVDTYAHILKRFRDTQLEKHYRDYKENNIRS